MKRWVTNLLLVVFCAVFLVSGYFLLDYYLDSRQEQGQFDELAQMVSQATQPTRPPETQSVPEATDSTQPDSTEPAVDPNLVPVTDPRTGETVYMLPQYGELYQLNPDLVGWITIADTKLNYPVMQTPDRVDYYLHRNFYGEESSHGCIYVREECDVFAPSDNLTIYGHAMRDGTMFRTLNSYVNKSFYNAHRYIRFNTLTENHTYEILAVFRTTADRHGFSYHLFVDAADEEKFTHFVERCKRLSFYDTGVTAEYGDKLITLSTCEWSQKNGRLVVVAKRVE